MESLLLARIFFQTWIGVKQMAIWIIKQFINIVEKAALRCEVFLEFNWLILEHGCVCERGGGRGSLSCWQTPCPIFRLYFRCIYFNCSFKKITCLLVRFTIDCRMRLKLSIVDSVYLDTIYTLHIIKVLTWMFYFSTGGPSWPMFSVV